MIWRMDDLDIAALQRGCGLRGGVSGDDDHRPRAGPKRRIGDAADERFAGQFGDDFAGACPGKTRRAAGREDDRGDLAHAACSERKGFCRRAAITSAKMAMAISAALTAPMSSPI